MGQKEKDIDLEGRGLSRRDFLKATAATIAASGVADFAFNADKAIAYEGVAGYTIKTTTCPYCSASCGQRVVVRDSDQEVVDLYGDFDSPYNTGGLCAKGAGTFQLVTNPRRLGAYTFPMTYQNNTLADHPEDVPATPVFENDGTTAPVIYKRTGNGAWTAQPIGSTTVLSDIATALTSARGSFPAGQWSGYNSQSVAFFGCSHMNNEENYLYRRLIAQFGTTNTEHQARI